MSIHNFTQITIAVGAFYINKKRKLLAGLINTGMQGFNIWSR